MSDGIYKEKESDWVTQFLNKNNYVKLSAEGVENWVVKYNLDKLSEKFR